MLRTSMFVVGVDLVFRVVIVSPSNSAPNESVRAHTMLPNPRPRPPEGRTARRREARDPKPRRDTHGPDGRNPRSPQTAGTQACEPPAAQPPTPSTPPSAAGARAQHSGVPTRHATATTPSAPPAPCRAEPSTHRGFGCISRVPLGFGDPGAECATPHRGLE